MLSIYTLNTHVFFGHFIYTYRTSTTSARELWSNDNEMVLFKIMLIFN